MNKLEAIETLLNVDPTTVIDEGWWDSFMEDPKEYDAMMLLSGLKSYKEILDKFEGYLIREFLSEILNFEYEVK
jgi:hypothetical protein